MSADYECQILWALVHVLKQFHLVNVGACLASKLALFSMAGLKDEKLTKKQIYMKTETFENLLNISAKYHQNRSL